MDPIQYLPQTDPFAGLTQMMQAGANVGLLREKRAAAEAERAQQEQYRADVEAAMANPTQQTFTALTLKYPQQREAFAQGWKMQSEAQQKGEISLATQAYAALNADRPDIAEQVIQRRIDALKNSGQDAQDFEPLLDLVRTDPTKARGYAGLLLSHALGPEKFSETFAKLGQEQRASDEAPADLRIKNAGATKAEADAETAKVAAKFADQNAMLDLQKKGWDIKKVAADIDISREANRIALMNAVTSREGNDLKKQELQIKVQEARQALDDKIRAKVADAEGAAATMDNFLNTVQRVRNVAVDKDGKPTSTLRAAAGPVDSRLPTMQSDVADLEALIETMGSQAFLSQIPAMKGTGSLTEREGDKLQSSLSNLSLRQSPEQLIENVNEAFRLINKARGNLSTKTGVPLPAPDIPSAKPKTGTSDFQPKTPTTSGGATVSNW